MMISRPLILTVWEFSSSCCARDLNAEEYGHLDILIHNASNFNEGPLETVTEEVWNSSHEIILKGAFFLTQADVR